MPKYTIEDAPQQSRFSVGDSTSVTPTNGASIGAGKPEPWLNQLEDDLTYGGTRTLPGRILGRLQGRGDKGYSGMGEGPMGSGSTLASPVMGPLHALQGERQMIAGPHRLAGVGKMLSGDLQASELPMSLMAGPEAEAADEAIPSATRAGNMLQQIRNEAANVPVSMEKTRPELGRFMELTERGGRQSKPFRQLASRVITGESEAAPTLQGIGESSTGAIQAPSEQDPFLFPEGRDFYSNIGDATHQTPLQRLMGRGMKPVMRRQGLAVKHAMNEDLTNAAAQVGRGEDYTNAMREYANAMKLRKAVRTAGLLGAGEAARRTGLMGNWIHRTALTQ